jgi:glycosyltransferase involved in cell wall biosynthesis
MVKQNITVSVLMPAYNAESFIKESIESILQQTYKDFEFVIVDDASTDSTWNIIQEYSNIDKRIKAFRNSKNLYIAENRNKCIKLSNSEFIIWQDADDISEPTRIEKLLSKIESDPDIGLCGSYLEIFTSNGKSSTRTYSQNDELLRYKIFRYSPVAQPSSIVRRKSIERVGKYNPQLPPAEDIDMSFRIGEYYKFANVPEVLLKYRMHANSATFKNIKRIELNTIKIRMRYRKNKRYNFTLYDWIYNILQFSTLFMLPPKLRIYLFNLVRNKII